jgi:hypothetical protein
VRLEPAGEVVLVRPADRAADAGDRGVGVQQQHRRPLGAQLGQVGLGRQPGGVLEQPYQVRRRQVQLLGERGQRPRAGDVGLEQPHRAPHRRVEPARRPRFRAAGATSSGGGAAQLAEHERQQAEHVAPVPVQRAEPQLGQRVQVRRDPVERRLLQVQRHDAAPRRRVGGAPQQVAEQRVLAGPGELPVQQLAAEAAVVQLEPPAVLVAVPHAGPQQHDVADAQLPAPGQAVVRAGAAAHERDLHEAVRVQRVPGLVQVQAGVDQRPLGEVQQVVTGVHRHVDVGHVLRHVTDITPGGPARHGPKSISC